MSVLIFEELTHRLDLELQRLHYTEGSIKAYRRAWKHIASYLEQEGLDGFTEEAGMRYLDSRYDFSTREAAGTLTQSLINSLRIVPYAGRFSTAWQCVASLL